ncbi:MAG: hypothetical protein QXT45_07245, partial [Candidatus Bilamarchaeaceae archaeon]
MRLCRVKGCTERFVPGSHNALYCEIHRGKKYRPENLRDLSECLIDGEELGQDDINAMEEAQLESLLRQTRELSISRRFISSTLRGVVEELLGRPLDISSSPARHSSSRSQREAIVCLGDWQLGKLEGGVGVAELKERLSRVSSAAKSIITSSPNVTSITVLLLGDLIEGIWIYPG